MSTKLQSLIELQFQYPRRTRNVSSIGAHTPWDKGSADDVFRLINGMPVSTTGSHEKAINERLELERLVNTEMPSEVSSYGEAFAWLESRTKNSK